MDSGEGAPFPESHGQAPRQSGASRPRGSWTRAFAPRTLAILGGADPRILDTAPTETGRFVTMFFVLLSTTVLSGISMTFALATGVRVPVPVAIILGLFWMLVIFNLDRFLTSSMKATRNIGRLIGLALPRVAMAALIGIVVAEPLVLQIFANDIQQEVRAINQHRSTVAAETLADSESAALLDRARKELQNAESQAATGVVVGTELGSASMQTAQSAVDRLRDQLAAQQEVINQARAVYNCELTGQGAGTVAGCSGVAGEGSSSQAARNQLATAQSTYDELQSQYRDATDALAAAESATQSSTAASEARNRQEATDRLPALQAAYDAAYEAYQSEQQASATSNANATGLLTQMEAMHALAWGDPERGTSGNVSLGWAHFSIGALFFMIELLPVLVKVMTSYGDKSLYEEVEEQRKRALVEQSKVERNDARWEQQERSKARREQVLDMIELEKAQAFKANRYVAAEMEKVLDVALASWSQNLAASDYRQQTAAGPHA